MLQVPPKGCVHDNAVTVTVTVTPLCSRAGLRRCSGVVTAESSAQVVSNHGYGAHSLSLPADTGDRDVDHCLHDIGGGRCAECGGCAHGTDGEWKQPCASVSKAVCIIYCSQGHCDQWSSAYGSIMTSRSGIFSSLRTLNQPLHRSRPRSVMRGVRPSPPKRDRPL